jgi:hypothetical protein
MCTMCILCIMCIMCYVVLTATPCANIGRILDYIFYENILMCYILHLRRKTEHGKSENIKFAFVNVCVCVCVAATDFC